MRLPRLLQALNRSCSLRQKHSPALCWHPCQVCCMPPHLATSAGPVLMAPPAFAGQKHLLQPLPAGSAASRPSITEEVRAELPSAPTSTAGQAAGLPDLPAVNTQGSVLSDEPQHSPGPQQDSRQQDSAVGSIADEAGHMKKGRFETLSSCSCILCLLTTWPLNEMLAAAALVVSMRPLADHLSMSAPSLTTVSPGHAAQPQPACASV